MTEAGQTPLSMARVKRQQKVVQLLQAEGAIETAGHPDSEQSTLLYQRYSQPQVHPEPQIYQPNYRQSVSGRLPGQGFDQHCQAGCGSGVGDSGSPDGYRFRKAIAAIGRGEDPVSQGVERTVQGMVKISYEHFPEETQKVLNGLAASGEAVDAVIDFADRTTGRVVSKKLNSLDQRTRDELAGYGKILSVVVPVSKVKGLTAPKNYFGSKTKEDIKEVLETKFGSPESQREHADTYYNKQTKRSFNVHEESGHNNGKPHVDVRRRGGYEERKYDLKDME
ncbi:MAG: hypothetical protein ACPG5T_10775 [Endozoicomonas sp.]